MSNLQMQATLLSGGTPWRSWLRHCATSRKVAGWIPDGVIEIFHTVALRSTQLLTEMCIRNTFSG